MNGMNNMPQHQDTLAQDEELARYLQAQADAEAAQASASRRAGARGEGRSSGSGTGSGSGSGTGRASVNHHRRRSSGPTNVNNASSAQSDQRRSSRRRSQQYCQLPGQLTVPSSSINGGSGSGGRDVPLPPPPPPPPVGGRRTSGTPGTSSSRSRQQQQQQPKQQPKQRRSTSRSRRSGGGANEQQQQQQQQQQRHRQSAPRSQSTSRTTPRNIDQGGEGISSSSSRGNTTNNTTTNSNSSSKNKSKTRDRPTIATDIAAKTLSTTTYSSATSEAELARRKSRLAEIQNRSEARLYGTQISDEERRIKRLSSSAAAPLGPYPAPSAPTAPPTPSEGSSTTDGGGTGVGGEGGGNQGRGQQHQQHQQRRGRKSGRDTSSGANNLGGGGNGGYNTNNNANNTNHSQPPLPEAYPVVVVDDEKLARELHAEMLREQEEAEAVRQMEQQFEDEELARSLAAAEAARMSSLGLSPADVRASMSGGGGGNDGNGRRGWSACNTVHKMISFVIMAGCVGIIMFVLFGIVYRSAGGDVENLPPWFQDSWGKGWEGDFGGENADPGDFQSWRIKKGGGGGKGLSLTLINALTDDWQDHFYRAVNEWNSGTPRGLDLTIVLNSDPPPCEQHTRGMVKVCNADYGRTDWTGLNELLFENGYIVSSVAMMNENYLRNARDQERQYVMCHELGHAWGLPHRDEIVGNKDLGTCMDYTLTPENNMTPDEVDFQNLVDVYGEVTPSRRRMQGSDDIDIGDTHSNLQKLRDDAIEDLYRLIRKERRTLEGDFTSTGSSHGWRRLYQNQHGGKFTKVLTDRHRLDVSVLFPTEL